MLSLGFAEVVHLAEDYNVLSFEIVVLHLFLLYLFPSFVVRGLRAAAFLRGVVSRFLEATLASA